MRSVVSIAATLVVLTSAWLTAQEPKPVPKDSVRVTIPGCSKGYVFTASRRTPDEPGSSEITEGMHIRMNGPKKLMGEIKAHEGSMIATISSTSSDVARLSTVVGYGHAPRSERARPPDAYLHARR